MKFKKGDRVRFLNDIGGGMVNRIDEQGHVYVLTEDGFEIPVLEKELVLSRNLDYNERIEEPEVKIPVNPVKKEAGKPARDTVEKAPELPNNISGEADSNILIGFVPETQGPVFASKIACYLVNDSPWFLYYLTGCKEGGVLRYLSSGYLEPDMKNLLASFDQTSLSKISDLHVQVIFVSKGRYEKKEPLDGMVRLGLVNFSKESYYRENDYFSDRAILFNANGTPVTKTNDIKVPEEVLNEKEQADAPVKARKKEPAQDTLEIDLHFDEENSRLTPSAIMALQLSRFHAAVEEAIGKNLKRLVVIHGLGQGTLKMQIRKELQEKYPSFIFQDASFREYGFGATMIHLNIDQKQ
jgi:hypothetical protein